MILFDDLLSFSMGSIGMFKGCLQFSNICLQLLLHAKPFSFSLAFLLKSRLHGFNGLSKILFCALELLILLSNATFNLLPNLSEFKLRPQNLVFFLFKSSLCFFKGSLKLHFLSLQ